MTFVGFMLIVIAFILFFVRRNQKNKLKYLGLANSYTIKSLQNIVNQVAGEIGGGSLRDYIKIRGIIECDRPLISELKRELCVYYKMKVVREYEEEVTKQNSEGKTITEIEKKTATISEKNRSTPFYITDENQGILVDPEKANIETIQVLDQFQTEDNLSNFSLELGLFGRQGKTIGYHHNESILPLGYRVLVLGTATDEDGVITIRQPTDSKKPFIISLKSEEQLTKETKNAIRWTFYGMLFCLTLGIIILIVRLFNSVG
ncbi:MAG TPA: E3 ubiquitin ligase [Cyanothece sp. UBA12306]|nr:E3 ubiquitin ligase [Cyanothece sp. UBA12306]